MIIGAYKNGNYDVVIFEDGTKIRVSDNETFIPSRIESLDCKITNNCNMGCKFCHEKSTPDGKHADLNNPVIDTFEPYTEIAIGGGNPLAHPDLDNFLLRLKGLKCFPNITINQVHFIEEFERLKEMRDKKMFYGLGVSVFNPDEDLAKKLSEFPNAVVHTIAGITTMPILKKMSKLGIKKILILGYKIFGRGKDFYKDEIGLNIKDIRTHLEDVMNMFEVVSFDNLAINQLDVRFALGEEKWKEFYMGDDGNYTMYLDLVNKQYAQSSTSNERFNLLPTINDMFLDIRKKGSHDV